MGCDTVSDEVKAQKLLIGLQLFVAILTVVFWYHGDEIFRWADFMDYGAGACYYVGGIGGFSNWWCGRFHGAWRMQSALWIMLLVLGIVGFFKGGCVLTNLWIMKFLLPIVLAFLFAFLPNDIFWGIANLGAFASLFCFTALGVLVAEMGCRLTAKVNDKGKNMVLIFGVVLCCGIAAVFIVIWATIWSGWDTGIAVSAVSFILVVVCVVLSALSFNEMSLLTGALVGTYITWLTWLAVFGWSQGQMVTVRVGLCLFTFAALWLIASDPSVLKLAVPATQGSGPSANVVGNASSGLDGGGGLTAKGTGDEKKDACFLFLMHSLAALFFGVLITYLYSKFAFWCYVLGAWFTAFLFIWILVAHKVRK